MLIYTHATLYGNRESIKWHSRTETDCYPARCIPPLMSLPPLSGYRLQGDEKKNVYIHTSPFIFRNDQSSDLLVASFIRYSTSRGGARAATGTTHCSGALAVINHTGNKQRYRMSKKTKKNPPYNTSYLRTITADESARIL